MATINQIARDRRAALRLLRQTLKPIDSQVESMERKIKRLLGLRRNVPTIDQFTDIVNETRSLDRKLDTYTTMVQRVARVFNL